MLRERFWMGKPSPVIAASFEAWTDSGSIP